MKNIDTSCKSNVCDEKRKTLFNNISDEDLNLKTVISKIIGWRVFYTLSFSIVDSACRILQPQLMGEMISNFSHSGKSKSFFLSTTAIVLCSLTSTLAFYLYSLSTANIIRRISICSSTLVFQKVLQLKQSATHDTLKGELMNFMTAVTEKLQCSLATSHELYRAPLEAVLIGFLVYREMGSSGTIGAASLIIFVPVLFWFQRKIKNLVEKFAVVSGERAILMAEIIEKIKSVKMFCLEQPLARRIKEIRKREMKLIGGSFFYSTATYFLNFLVKVSIFACLVNFSKAGNSFNVRNVYVVISYYNLMGYSVLKCWPHSVTKAQEAKVIINKLQEFLLSRDNIFSKFHFNDKISCHEEANVRDKFTETVKLLKKPAVNEQHGNPGIFMQNVRLTSRKSRNSSDLRCDYLELREPKPYAVEGFSTSAEKSLLQIILGEIEVDSGVIEINGKISYASKDPCIVPGTVRQNILCREAFDDERYTTIIGICKLKKDLEVMSAGDGSFIDESTENKCFKAKINIARCLYRCADIYVFDDPFEAISLKMSKFILNKAIRTLLKNKMCIIAAKQRKLLHEIDDVIFMKNGTTCYETRTKSSKDRLELNFPTINPLKSQYSNKLHYGGNNSISYVDNQQTKDSININNQHNSRSKSKRNVYKLFVASINNKITLLCIGILFMCSQFTSSAIDLLLLKWVNWDASNCCYSAIIQTLASNDTLDENQIAELNYDDWFNYACFSFIALCLLFYFNIHRSLLFFKTCLRTSVSIHDELFCGITRASMNFFNCNSSKKILELFTNATAIVDVKLPPLFHDFFVFAMDFIAILIIIVIIVNYWLVLPTLFMLFLISQCWCAFAKVSRNVEKTKSITRNSIYSHIAATSHGLSTIHSTRSEELFLNEFHQRLYPYTSAMYLSNVAATKVAFWLEIICCFYICIVLVSFAWLQNKDTGGAEIGLAITHSLLLGVCCREGVRQMMELKNQINPAGRVFDYKSVTIEPPLRTPNKYRPLTKWPPNNPEIIFTNFHMILAPDSNYSLKDVSFRIGPGECVGFMGVGNDCIAPALLRLALSEGSIEIDDINIETLGLHDLRRAFSLIPSDPILFSGTLRSNLDPFDEKTDDEIWKALEHVEMKNSVSMLIKGLSTKVENCVFDVLDKQMLFLARAILNCGKILIFEEAVDVESELQEKQRNLDDLIKDVIRKKFTQHTIIKIAKRLDLIMDCDKVIMLDCGSIVENGHPYELIQTSRGYFRSFVDESGFINAMNLIKISERNYFMKKLAN